MALLRKVRAHLSLLRSDPEKFAFNLLQFSHPERFQERLLDLQTAAPLHVAVDAALRGAPVLNVLQPVISPAVMTGGPNTVVNLALWLARLGVPVRIVTSRATSDADLAWFWQHLSNLTGAPQWPQSLTVVSAADPAQPAALGPRDMFLATHWTTAQQVKAMLPRMELQRFFYLIQDFEPGFYAWSSNYALAMETYALDHIGVFNQRLLFDYFVAQGVGRYGDPAFASHSLVFEPAVDRVHFHPASKPRAAGPRRLLFYARPGNSRNMLGLGLAALRAAVAHPVFAQEAWEFLAIGGNNSLPPLSLGPGLLLRAAPWADYSRYGDLLRASDILLCPMLSPHTSYPVLEMAACGGIAVTNSFATKTTARLQALSANIIATPATEEALSGALVEAARRVAKGRVTRQGVDLPGDWNAALSGTAQHMARLFQHCVAEPIVAPSPAGSAPLEPACR